jgi:hypothetical protein
MPRILVFQIFLSTFLAVALAFPAAGEPSRPTDFTGLWWVSHGDGASLQLRLYPDGSAWSDYPANNPGKWEVRNGRAECVWADDWKEGLLRTPQGWLKLGYRPGQSIDSHPSNKSRAVRASTRADGWFGYSP